MVLLLAGRPQTSTAAQDGGLIIRITQVDNSEFPKVTVYISISGADGEPIRVEADRIQLYEDGVLIHPDEVRGAGETRPLTTLLIMDVSGSMLNGGKLEIAKVAASAYVAKMQPKDQVGLISFNTQVNIEQEITENQQMLHEAIGKLQAQGDTAMHDALLKAVKIIEGEKGRKAILVLTDGLDNRSTASSKDVIAAVGPGGLSISTIGLGDPAAGRSNDGLDELGLRSLAEQAGGQYSFASDTVSLQAIYELTERTLHSEYAITYTSPTALRDGVNRNLTIALDETRLPAVASYNPGGVLPEVADNNWTLFGGAMAVLVVLGVFPGIIRQFSEMRAKKQVKNTTKMSRIKLK